MGLSRERTRAGRGGKVALLYMQEEIFKVGCETLLPGAQKGQGQAVMLGAWSQDAALRSRGVKRGKGEKPEQGRERRRRMGGRERWRDV